MTTTNSTYHIKEAEIAYVIDALNSAFMYLELNCDGMSTEGLWESMGIMHNLKSADSGELYWTPMQMARAIDQVVDAKVWEDTDYFD